MQELREGMSGPEVTELQNSLQRVGFSPGKIDGDFGPGTEAAVMAFQRSHGLLADGVVGERTARALEVPAAELPPPADMPDISVAVVAKMFPQTPVRNITLHLPEVLAALKRDKLTTVPVVLAALATIRAETESFRPIDEFQSRFNTSPGGAAFDLYDNRRDLGNQGPPDGANFKGRGFIQLTGRHNYEKFGPIIGLPTLAKEPDKANDPDVAARLLSAFIKAKEIELKDALLHDDLRAARRLVNGGSHGLERFTEAYRIGQRLLGA